MGRRAKFDPLAAIKDWNEIQDVPEVAEIVKIVADLDITSLQKRALSVQLLPQSPFMSEKQKAEMAKVSPRQWYNLQRSKRFIDAGIEASRRLIGAKIPSITAAFCRDAMLGNAANQERALAMVGILGGKILGGEDNPSVTNTYIFNYGNSLTDEERNQIDRNIGAIFGQNGHRPDGSGPRSRF